MRSPPRLTRTRDTGGVPMPTLSDQFVRQKTTVRCILTFALSAVVCLCAAPRARAQQDRAALGGRVTDPQGAAVPNAIVVLTSNDTGVTRQTQTDAQELDCPVPVARLLSILRDCA